MKLAHTILFAASLLAGCFESPFAGFKVGDRVKGSTYGAPISCVDYRADGTFLAPLDNSQKRGLDGFQEVRARVQELFDSELEPDFGIPVAVLETLNAVELEVVDNETIFASFPVPFQDDEINVDATIRVNKDTRRLEDEFVVNGIKRFTVAHDLFGTVANATIFNKDAEPIFNADFSRTGEAISLLIANANNENSFLIEADRNSLFLGREKDHNGDITKNFEFQLRANTDNVAGQFDAKIIFIGSLQICFGKDEAGQVGRAECGDVASEIEGVGDNVGAF